MIRIFIYVSAWLVRLWEIVNAQGVVAIVGKDDAWNKKSLDVELKNRYDFLFVVSCNFFS